MNSRASRSTILVVPAVLVFCCAALGTPGAGDQKQAAHYDPPKLADGAPDFRGIWQARTAAYLNIEGHPAQTGVAAAKSLIVDPSDGKIPYLPAAMAKRDANRKNLEDADPASNCFQAGVPRAVYLPTPFQIVQSVGNMAIVYTDDHAFQIVLPSSIPHDDGIDFFMGDSRGHWEGNTLVVDVVDLGDQTWLDAAGNYHSDQLHVVGRYTMTGPDTMTYEATLADPGVYSRPWTLRVQLYRDKQPGARIIEDECLEGADGRWHHLSPFDPKALVRHDYQAEMATAAKSQGSEKKQ
jgi:hypothetical protein